MRVVAVRERDRLVGSVGPQTALDPGLAAEQQPEPPAHDLVVVDHQDAQARSRSRGLSHRRGPPAAGTSGRPAPAPTPRPRRAAAPRGPPDAGPRPDRPAPTPPR